MRTTSNQALPPESDSRWHHIWPIPSSHRKPSTNSTTHNLRTPRMGECLPMDDNPVTHSVPPQFTRSSGGLCNRAIQNRTSGARNRSPTPATWTIPTTKQPNTARNTTDIHIQKTTNMARTARRSKNDPGTSQLRFRTGRHHEMIRKKKIHGV